MRDNSKKRRARGAALTAVAAATVTVALAGCATSSSSSPPPPTFSVTMAPGSSVTTITLTPLGATRIGLRTATVAAGANDQATFPYSALLYEPNGQAAVYVSTGPLSFQRSFVTVGSIVGDTVTVTSGVTAGQRIATDGSEELLGVQNGVEEQS